MSIYSSDIQFQYPENEYLPDFNNNFLFTDSEYQNEYLNAHSEEPSASVSEDQTITPRTCNNFTEVQTQSLKRIRTSPNEKDSNPKKTPTKRKGNSIVANASRQLMNSIKTVLREKKNIYLSQQLWNRNNKVKSQIWAVDALCFKLLQLRDLHQQISMTECLDILLDYNAKLKQKLENHQDQASINKIKCYQLHLSLYVKSDFSFSTISYIFQQENGYFKGLVKSRLNTLKNCIKKLTQIYSKLSLQQTPYENDLETQISTLKPSKPNKKKTGPPKIKRKKNQLQQHFY